MPDVFVNKNPKKDELQDSPDKKKHTEKDLPMPNNESIIDPKNGPKFEGWQSSPLAAYELHPKKVSFINQDPEEKVILLLRRHPITNMGWILLAILMVIAPLALKFVPILSFLPDRFQFFAVVLWYLIIVAFVLEEFLSWFFSVYIITDERVVDVDFVNLIYREVSDANIDQIQDVTVQVGSFVKTFFDFGHVVIQTAAEIPQIIFDDVPHPDQVARVLRELRVQEEQEKLEGRVR